MSNIADSYVGLESRIWIANPERGKFKQALSEHVRGVKEPFDAEGIEMPYPYRELTGGISIEEERSRPSGRDRRLTLTVSVDPSTF